MISLRNQRSVRLPSFFGAGLSPDTFEFRDRSPCYHRLFRHDRVSAPAMWDCHGGSFAPAAVSFSVLSLHLCLEERCHSEL